MTVAGAGTLAIQPVTLGGKTYELCEFKLDLDSKGQNPFRQTELAVDSEFTLPSGKTMMVPAFYSQDYTNVSHKGVAVSGSAGWRLRFSGPEAGIYHFKVRVTEKGKGNGGKGRSGIQTGEIQQPRHDPYRKKCPALSGI